MPNWLPLYAGVNLAAALIVAWPALARRSRPAGRLLLAAVPALWALGSFAAFLYFRATMPPSPTAFGPDGSVIIRHHGDPTLIDWEDQVGMAHRVAFGVTLVTLLGLVLLWATRSIWVRRGRGRHAAA